MAAAKASFKGFPKPRKSWSRRIWWGMGAREVLCSRATEFAPQRTSLDSQELDSASMWCISIVVTSSEHGCGVEARPERFCAQPGSAGTCPQAAQRCRGLGTQQPGSSLLPLVLVQPCWPWHPLLWWRLAAAPAAIAPSCLVLAPARRWLVLSLNWSVG